MSAVKGMQRFTKEDIQFCKTHYKDMTIKELAQKLNHPPGGVANLLNRCGIYKKVWTPERVAFLKAKCFKYLTIKEVAARLNLTESQVKRELQKLGIRKRDFIDPKTGRTKVDFTTNDLI